MTVAQLIALLLPIFAQAAPQLIKDVVDLIHGNPQQTGETDDQYIARLGQMIDANTQKVVDQDAEIQK